MPSEAQLAKINTATPIGKTANKMATIAGVVRALETQQVPQVCCGLWNTLNIAANSGAWTILTFDTEVYDAFSMHTAGDSKVYGVVPGKYVVSACVEWAGSVSAVGGAGVALVRNGALVFARQYYYVDIRTVQVSGMVHLQSATDYVEVMAYQATGAPVNVVTSSQYSPTFAVHKYG